MSDENQVRNEVQAWLKSHNVTAPIAEQPFRIPGTMKSEQVPCYIIPVVEMNRLYNAIKKELASVVTKDTPIIEQLKAAGAWWFQWNGNYEKQYYDVWVKGCDVVLGCYPNDGYMCAMDGSDRMWKPEEILAVRVSDFQSRYPKPNWKV